MYASTHEGIANERVSFRVTHVCIRDTFDNRRDGAVDKRKGVR